VGCKFIELGGVLGKPSESQQMSIVSGDASSGLTADVYERSWDVLQILSRALRAVHYYETLRPASGQLLADRGLKHGDLPRAAFSVLVGETYVAN
jgi:hypothetical protein